MGICFTGAKAMSHDFCKYIHTMQYAQVHCCYKHNSNEQDSKRQKWTCNLSNLDSQPFDVGRF